MIGDLTQLTLDAMVLALTYEQITWSQSDERFAELRDEANRLLQSMEIGQVEIPRTQRAFLEHRSAIRQQIADRLAEARSKILGDTVALPLFWLASAAYRAAWMGPLGYDCEAERGFVEDCLEDIGLERELVDRLDEEIGWITVREGESEDPSIDRRQVIRAGASFVVTVIEKWGTLEDTARESSALIRVIQDLREEVKDFREEFREGARRLESLIVEGTAEIAELVSQIRRELIKEGIDEAEATQVATTTVEDAEGLWARLMRWSSNAPWRDVAEKATWAALDFVPGGTGVKLGISITKAVREALKAKSGQ